MRKARALNDKGEKKQQQQTTNKKTGHWESHDQVTLKRLSTSCQVSDGASHSNSPETWPLRTLSPNDTKTNFLPRDIWTHIFPEWFMPQIDLLRNCDPGKGVSVVLHLHTEEVYCGAKLQRLSTPNKYFKPRIICIFPQKDLIHLVA